MDMSQLELPDSVSLFSTRQPSSLVSLTYLFICLLISNSTLLKNDFRKPVFKKFHLVVSLGPTSFWVKPPECLGGRGGMTGTPGSLCLLMCSFGKVRGWPHRFLYLSPTGSGGVSHIVPSWSRLWFGSQRGTCLRLGPGPFRPRSFLPWAPAFLPSADLD